MFISTKKQWMIHTYCIAFFSFRFSKENTCLVVIHLPRPASFKCGNLHLVNSKTHHLWYRECTVSMHWFLFSIISFQLWALTNKSNTEKYTPTMICLNSTTDPGGPSILIERALKMPHVPDDVVLAATWAK